MRDDPRILPVTGPHRKRPSRRWLVVLLLALVPLLLVPLVPNLLMVRRTAPAHSDAIYVFPGQIPERAVCAAELYRNGTAPRVVFTGAHVAPELLVVDRPLSDAVLNARVAAAHGVPDGAEVVLSEGTSTWEDAVVLGNWMRSSGAREIVAVTSPTHSRRALWSLRTALGGLGSKVTVYPCGTVYGLDWWARERSLVRVTEEALKLGFYALRYFLPALFGFGVVAAEAPDEP